MASLRDLKSRITSVKNTRKITRAMKMVAASKMNRAVEAASRATLPGNHQTRFGSVVAAEDDIEHPLYPSRTTTVMCWSFSLHPIVVYVVGLTARSSACSKDDF